MLANALTYDTNALADDSLTDGLAESHTKTNGNITEFTLNFRGLNHYGLWYLFQPLKNFIPQTIGPLHSDEFIITWAISH
jgi:hypothetical protein